MISVVTEVTRSRGQKAKIFPRMQAIGGKRKCLVGASSGYITLVNKTTVRCSCFICLKCLTTLMPNAI